MLIVVRLKRHAGVERVGLGASESSEIINGDPRIEPFEQQQRTAKAKRMSIDELETAI